MDNRDITEVLDELCALSNDIKELNLLLIKVNSRQRALSNRLNRYKVKIRSRQRKMDKAVGPTIPADPDQLNLFN